MSYSVNNLKQIQNNIHKTLLNSGRNTAECCLVAVSKTFDQAAIHPILEAGQRIFGENRVQEAKAKWPCLRENYSDIELHLIGPLQTNKVKEAVSLFDVIETVDRPKIAKALSQEMQKQQRNLPVYIQVNIGNEDQKAGIAVDDLDSFVAYCKSECQLNVIGLMCIPPFDEAPEPYFTEMKKLQNHLNLTYLSMGMSGDYEAAIKAGATSVRVGSAIFGGR